MSVQAIASVLENSEMKGTARLVLIALANRDGDHGIHPSIDALARDCRMSRRAVQEAIRRCVEAGELHVEPNAGPNGTNRYWLHIDRGGCRFCTRADPAPVQIPAGKLHPNPRNKNYPPESSRNPSGSSNSPPPTGDRLDDAFGEFWRLYPRKVGKRAARAAFERAARRASVDAILEGVRRFAADPNLPEKSFIPHPTTWLNQDRWEDEPLPPRTGQGSRRGDPGGRNRAFRILEQAGRMREERLRGGSPAGRPPLRALPGGGP
ncbi:hypothetical protein HRbin12_01215 [bacterium HR12]|nr:hypothetical protein HRbin12_01215 [bacterium HR12]